MSRPSASSSRSGSSTTSPTPSTSTGTRSTASVRDIVIAVRELDLGGLQPRQRNWVNDHTVYTHGYGVVAAFGNQREADGEPAFFQAGIPSSGPLGDFEQRIYFGEMSPPVLDRRCPEGGEASASSTTRPTRARGRPARTTRSPATAASRMGDGFTRLLYAIKFRDENILLSDTVNAESQILYDRTPRERVEKVAPLLTLDGDPYPAVVDGRVVWIVDGYTTTDAYPYSDLQPLDDATTDRLTQTRQPRWWPRRARSTTSATRSRPPSTPTTARSTLYAWDEEDPILEAWRTAFPGAVQPMSEIDGRPDEPPALPRGPVQGAARGARPVPRHRPRRVLLGAGPAGRSRRSRPTRTRHRRPGRTRTSRRTT